MLTQIPNPLTFFSLLTNGATQTANEATTSAYGDCYCPFNPHALQMELLKPKLSLGKWGYCTFKFTPYKWSF
jgi:hypothetical protein